MPSRPLHPRRAAIARLIRAMNRDDGAAAVSFILTFPIFLMIVSIIVQLGLMVNAKLMVAHAADAAARAAATSLPDERPDNVERAAWMALAPLSPPATGGAASEATRDYEALQAVGAEVPDAWPARYTYAMSATEVAWTPDHGDAYVRRPGEEVEVTVRYRFRLTVPGAMRLIGRDDDIAGVSGRFWEVSGTGRAVTSHGRKARTYGNGWPR